MSSLLRLGRKQKNSSNAFRIHIFLFRSYLLGIERINTFIRSRSSLENQPDSRPKWAKSGAYLMGSWQSLYPFSDQKGPKPYPWGRGKDYNREDRKIVYSAGRLWVYYTELATERERHLATGKRGDFRCLFCRPAIGQASCLFCARRGQLTFPFSC